MNFFKSAYQFFIGDIRKAYVLLSPNLRQGYWVAFLLLAVQVVLEVNGILFLTFMASSLSSVEAAQVHIIGRALNKFAPSLLQCLSQDQRYLALGATVGVVLFISAKNFVAAVLTWYSARLAERISYFFASLLMHRYLYSSYMWHISGKSGGLMMAMSGRVPFSQMIIMTLSVHTYILSAIVLCIIMLSATPGIMYGAITITTLIAYILYLILKHKVDKAGIESARAAEDENNAMMNAMNGLREVLIYRQQRVFLDAYLNACKKGISGRTFLVVSPPIPSWVLETCGFGLILASIILMTFVSNRTMGEINTAMAVLLITVWRVLPYANRAMGNIIGVRGIRPMAMQCIEGVSELRHTPAPELPEPDPNFRFDHKLQLENISFRYPGSEAFALKDISIKIPKGWQIGVVGPSGAGKSTLAGIISGLMEPAGGQMIVDGQELSPQRHAAYMHKIGYVAQAPYLMAGTLAQNVAFSQWGQPIDEARVRQACHMAALDIIDTHEKGIDLPIGERGAGISGGQAQRLSIARALYTNPSLLILDEATSSLDQANEDAIMRTIDSFRGRLAAVIIAHRLSTVQNCDTIVWMDEGKIVKQGLPGDILPEYRQALAKRAVEACLAEI
jgi:ABC-type multidrug transport system fused ATPase/permease subunit